MSDTPKGHKGSPVLGWGRAKVVELFGADLRSLAVLRMVLAVLVLADLANRASDLTAHYTDQGALPRGVLVSGELNRWSFSLNLMNGELYFQVLVFGVGALAALALLVGYHTRLASIIVWVAMLSIQWRNPLVLTAGDTLLRMLLFWGMFLPLGAYWSVERLLNATSQSAPLRLSMRFLSFATVGLFLQIAFMYWFTAIQKSAPEWRVDGTAIYYALSLDQISTPFGTYLLNFPTLLTVLTFATIGLEFVGPVLLFFPLLTGPVRTVTIAAFMSFHLGIWLSMEIGFFPWVSAFCMVCFLPGWFWDETAKLRKALRTAILPEKPDLVRRVQRRAARLVDGLADAYERLPSWTESSTVESVGRPSALSSTATNGDDNQPGSHVPHASTHLVNARMKERSKAPLAAEDNATPASGPLVLRSSLATNLLALFFLLYVFLWNLTTVSSLKMPESVAPLGHILGLKQGWGMFAPYPGKTDGWFVIPGTLSGGRQVDLMGFIRDEPSLPIGISWEKPQYIPDTFKNEHWRKYLNNIQEDENDNLRKSFGRYICRQWNARHTSAERLESFQIAFMKERTLPDYQTPTPQKTVSPEHTCS